MNKNQSMGIWLVIGILVLALASTFFAAPTTSTKNLTYTEFLNKVKSAEIKEVVISNDITATYADGKTYVVYVVDGSRIGENNIETTISGNTDTLTSWHLWYDTTNNIIKRFNNNNQVVDNKCSLPICVYLTNSSTITSIDQVFNGFGYIGSTVFALPSVKFSSIKGRNTDGTYITHTITNTSVKTVTRTSAWSNVCISCDWYNDSNEVNEIVAVKDVIIVKKLPDSFQNYTTYINLEDGFSYYKGAEGVDIGKSNKSAYKIATLSFGTNGTISDFNICSNVFSAINFQDSALVSGWSMPSSRYIDLTLGASGASYTAPANGYITIAGLTTGIPNEIRLENAKNYMVSYASSPSSGFLIGANIEVSKGDSYKIWYTGINGQVYRFIYAEGEQ
jgi:hypothetical protein